MAYYAATATAAAVGGGHGGAKSPPAATTSAKHTEIHDHIRTMCDELRSKYSVGYYTKFIIEIAANEILVSEGNRGVQDHEIMHTFLPRENNEPDADSYADEYSIDVTDIDDFIWEYYEDAFTERDVARDLALWGIDMGSKVTLYLSVYPKNDADADIARGVHMSWRLQMSHDIHKKMTFTLQE
jgi:hypothetical protein